MLVHPNAALRGVKFALLRNEGSTVTLLFEGAAVLEMNAVAVKLYSIRGVVSKRYLCMNRKGQLSGQKRRSEKCIFQVNELPNSYTTYSSMRYSRGTALALVPVHRQERTRQEGPQAATERHQLPAPKRQGLQAMSPEDLRCTEHH
ncbi:hypothetical protein HPB51_002483 [Rhipicephalus microplus]|uniref:Fibroblast growth factor n=1 Tax=Rhipicephalus microplus TaxID=6941 RepID=A0A9J6DF32_RHIMP|nr:hypothetical protein HPB51_002483 [Rhipicephalus microplus]